jgi:hypothetical protein
MELCEGGDPLEFIQKRGPLMDCKARHLFRWVAVNERQL